MPLGSAHASKLVKDGAYGTYRPISEHEALIHLKRKPTLSTPHLVVQVSIWNTYIGDGTAGYGTRVVVMSDGVY
jgi:hypothetical protein